MSVKKPRFEQNTGSCYSRITTTGMDDQLPGASHYAILIGIDAYPILPLKGCVNDVQKIRECIESKLSFGMSVSVNIRALIAPVTEAPVAETKDWPTYRNVTLALERIVSEAKCGDFVFIHYSGHGTRLMAGFDFSNLSTGDLALVLLKGDKSPEPLLRGPRLAGLLKSMVDKGLVVTVVLDCCFSASVYRTGEPNVRYLPCNEEEASALRLAEPDESPPDLDINYTERDATMRDNWLINPDGYAILAACGPHEKAKGGSEINQNEEPYGALSYFLYRALSDYGFGKTHEHIHRHLCAKFWESCVPQHPVTYGNKDQGFFGQPDPDYDTKSFCIVEHDGSLQLLAGQAHGFQDGDRLAISPPGHLGRTSAIARIVRARPLTSELGLLDNTHHVQTGFIAKPLSCSYLSKFKIQLALNLPQYAEWLTALEKRSLGTQSSSSHVQELQVVLNENNEYEILDSCGQKIINLPTMPRDETDANHVCAVLEHLARFNMVRSLTNQIPTKLFQDSFNVQITSDDGRSFDPGEHIEVQHNSMIKATIENTGHTVLYCYMYDLGPLWRVKGMLRGTYEPVPPQKYPRNGDQEFSGWLDRKIRLKVPMVMQEHGSCEDVIKVIVTSQPASFESLEQPNLGELVDETNTGDRIFDPSSLVQEDWVALNFYIRTSIKR